MALARWLGVGALGFLVGVAVGSLLVPTELGPAPPEESSRRTGDGALPAPTSWSTPTRPALEVPCTQLPTSRDATLSELADLETRLAELEGTPTPWQSEGIKLQTYSSATAALTAVLAGSGYGLEALDCDEPPCIVALSEPPDLGGSGLFDPQLQSEIKATFKHPIHYSYARRKEGFFWVFDLPGTGMGGAEPARTEYRLRRLSLELGRGESGG